LWNVSNEGIWKWSGRHVLSFYVGSDKVPDEPNEKKSDKNLDNHHVAVRNEFVFLIMWQSGYAYDPV
jgi:hypothetical protein